MQADGDIGRLGVVPIPWPTREDVEAFCDQLRLALVTAHHSGTVLHSGPQAVQFERVDDYQDVAGGIDGALPGSMVHDRLWIGCTFTVRIGAPAVRHVAEMYARQEAEDRRRAAEGTGVAPVTRIAQDGQDETPPAATPAGSVLERLEREWEV